MGMITRSPWCSVRAAKRGVAIHAASPQRLGSLATNNQAHCRSGAGAAGRGARARLEHIVGVALQIARRAKERTQPELAASSRCHLTVLGIEVGGRWSAQAVFFICRARAAPPAPPAACTEAFALRWSALLSFAATRAFTASLVGVPLTELPPLASRLLYTRCGPGFGRSRLGRKPASNSIRRRRSTRTRKREDGRVSSGAVGRAVNTRAA